MDKKQKKARAAALSYDPNDGGVPVLSAFGEGHVAEKIIEKAHETGVPVMKDPSLADMLSKMSIGDEIPPELYEVVARILVFVSELDRDYKNRIRSAAEKR